jgi:hypothetical protein
LCSFASTQVYRFLAEVSSYPELTLSKTTTYLLNTAYMWPTADLYILAVVNSPLIWAYMWRNVAHGKDEALRLFHPFTETLPIASPSEIIRAEAKLAVTSLITIAQVQDQVRRTLLDWLRTEFGVETPGAQLEVGRLDEEAFIAEVRKRLPKTANHLTPAKLKQLRDGYREQAQPVQKLHGEALTLERRLDALVNAAYGLTPEEVALLWETAPPRMPLPSPKEVHP